MANYNPSFGGDPYARTGIWGDSTSVVNCCEEDYAITRFVAEFINSLSNLAYVYYALKYPGHRGDDRSMLRHLDSLATALLFVGIASTAFHATLHQVAQLTDDLSMLVLAGALMQKLYCTSQPFISVRLVTMAIWLPTVIVSLIYVRSGNVLIHLYAFGTMSGLIAVKVLYSIYNKVRSEQETGELVMRFWKGVAFLAVAFTVCIVDTEMCFQLRQMRQLVGLPWAWLFELHGWWHIWTAVAAARLSELVRLLCDPEAVAKPHQGGDEQANLLGRRHRNGHVFDWQKVPSRLSEKSKADLDRIGAAR